MKIYKRSRLYLYFIVLVKKYDWRMIKTFFTDESRLYFFSARDFKNVSRKFKMFLHFNNKQPASWVAHTANDFLTCYSCSYYSSMVMCEETHLLNISSTFAKISTIHTWFKCRPSSRKEKIKCVFLPVLVSFHYLI